MESNLRTTILNCIRVILGGIFLWASWDKILAPEAFAQIIENYQLLPDALIPAVAVLLPWVEAVCGLCLITGFGAGGAALIVSALMVVFIGALAVNLFRGIDVNCGCFSVDASEPGNTPLEIGRDVVILAAAVWVMVGQTLKTGRQSAAQPLAPHGEESRL